MLILLEADVVRGWLVKAKRKLADGGESVETYGVAIGDSAQALSAVVKLPGLYDVELDRVLQQGIKDQFKIETGEMKLVLQLKMGSP